METQSHFDGSGIKKYNYDGTLYDKGYHDGYEDGITADNIDEQKVKLVEENNRLKKLLKKAWCDGYSVSDSDNFHGKNTKYNESEFYKEQINDK